MSMARKAPHAAAVIVLWAGLAVLLLVGGSVFIRTALIGRSFEGPWLDTVNASRGAYRKLPLSYADEIATVSGVKSVAWFAFNPSLEVHEIIALSPFALGRIDAAGVLRRRSLAPDWITVDADSVQRWQADPNGVLVSADIARAHGWKVGEVMSIRAWPCGKPFSVHLIGIVMGNVGRRALAHYEQVNDAARGCPSQDRVSIFDSEVDERDQEHVAAEIDRRFRGRELQSMSLSAVDLYWMTFGPMTEEVTQVVNQLFVMIALVLVVFLLLLARARAPSARLVWGAQLIAVVVISVLFAKYRSHGAYFHWTWGLENVLVCWQAYVAAIAITSLLAASFRSLVAGARRAAAVLAGLPGSAFLIAAGAIGTLAIGCYFGAEDGLDRAVLSTSMTDVTVIYPAEIEGREDPTELQDRVRELMHADPGNQACLSLRESTWSARYAKTRDGRFVATRVHAFTPTQATCRFLDPAIEPGALVDVGGASGIDAFAIGDKVWPVRSPGSTSAARVRHRDLVTDLEQVRKTSEIRDLDTRTFLFARTVPPSLAKLDAEPWPSLALRGSWSQLDLVRGTLLGLVIWALLWTLIVWCELRSIARCLGALVVGAAAGVAGTALLGALGVGGLIRSDLYTIRYAFAVGSNALHAVGALSIGTIVVAVLVHSSRRFIRSPG